jgi:hypothetical protein
MAERTEFIEVSPIGRAEAIRVERVESIVEDPARWKQSSLAPAW